MTPPRLVVPALACAIALTCVACEEGPVGRSATPDRYESDDGEGGGEDEGARPSSPSPSASATPEALSEEDAAAAAAEIRLVPSDLPGSTAVTDGSGEDEVTAAWEEFRDCAGADAERLADSPLGGLRREQSGSTQLVSGVVSVLDDPSSVEADVEAFRSEDAAECAAELATSVVGSLVGSEAEVSEPEVSDAESTVTGAEGYGHRVELEVTSGTSTVPVTVDLVGFAQSRTEVAVVLLGIQADVPPEERSALLARLADRAGRAP